MLFRHGLFAILLGVSTAMAQTSAEPPAGTGITRGILQSQPLEQTPTLRAPGSAEDLITSRPYPMPPQAAPVLPAPLIQQPVRDAEPITAKPAVAKPITAEQAVPRPRPRPSRRTAIRPERVTAEEQRTVPEARSARVRTERPVRATRGRVSVRSRSRVAGRPLNIVPPVARAELQRAPSQTTTSAFAPERPLPVFPWPFPVPTARTDSRFDVPAGLW